MDKFINTKIFKNTKPINGDGLLALIYCLENSGKSKSTKKNRL